MAQQRFTIGDVIRTRPYFFRQHPETEGVQYRVASVQATRAGFAYELRGDSVSAQAGVPQSALLLIERAPAVPAATEKCTYIKPNQERCKLDPAAGEERCCFHGGKRAA